MIFWIASYPKNGNTWLRSILSAYYFTKDGNFKDDKILKNIPQFPEKKYFTNFVYDKKIPTATTRFWIKAQEIINKDKKIKFFKTHNAYSSIDSYNFSNKLNSIAAIYIVRDPRNVITSFARHNSKEIEDTLELLINDLTIGNEKNEPEVYMGSWNFNYNSWKVYNSSNKYFLVKYEDLVNDTKKVFIQTLNFINKVANINISIDEDKIDKAIKTTSFSRMQNLEEQFGFEEAKINEITGQKVKFFNLGPKNHWENSLDEKLRKKIENRFKKEMIELNYL
mgnify:CR=1 FL=1